ncbi:MAG: gene transfer agent family protein [Rhizobiales bacterium]|nr:gene transfer agent family protein [Hyphomicrobiales bacterium]
MRKKASTPADASNSSALSENRRAFFGSGRISARDAIRVIGAGLRGAGERISDEDVAALASAGAAAGYVRIVVELLSATFGAAEAKSGRACRHTGARRSLLACILRQTDRGERGAARGAEGSLSGDQYGARALSHLSGAQDRHQSAVSAGTDAGHRARRGRRAFSAGRGKA